MKFIRKPTNNHWKTNENHWETYENHWKTEDHRKTNRKSLENHGNPRREKGKTLEAKREKGKTTYYFLPRI